MSPDVFSVCIAALVAVFVLLTVLAVVMRLLQVIFPAAEDQGLDEAMLAVIVSTVETVYPGTRVTAIKEDS